MSERHPIIAVTGSSGSGSSRVMEAFVHICRREKASVAVVDGDGFHRYDRKAFARVVTEAAERDEHLSHFSPECNLFDRLDALLSEYAAHGTGQHRRYLHDEIEAAPYHQPPGTLTPWEPIPEETDLLFYQGLHGCFVDDAHDIAQHMDLKIGAVPVVNLEWIRKIHRDINFQRVPTVDTSNPFIALDEPSNKETVVVIRVAHPEVTPVDFRYLLRMIPKSFMSRRNSIVVPGDEMGYAMELILTPLVHALLDRRRSALRAV
jgi:phosphoribulokinase